MIRQFALATFCLAVSATGAPAATLDASSWTGARSYGQIIGQMAGVNQKQSALVKFTVQNTGTLSSIELALSGSGAPGGALLTILREKDFNPTLPAGFYQNQEFVPAVYTKTVSLSSLPANFTGENGTVFDLSAGSVTVTAGEVMIFVLGGDAPQQPANAAIGNAFSFWFSDRDTPGIESYTSGNTGLKFGRGDDVSLGDLGFRTYVNTAQAPVAGVPEPTTWGLMIVGFGITGFGCRKRRRVSVAFA